MAGEKARRPKAKALGLLSGGLDSTLAAKMLQEQGVEVEGIHFSTGFCMVDHRRALGRPADRENPARIRNEALRAGADLKAPVEIVDVAEEYLHEVVLNPKHGYGSAMNPCIDCRIFMLKKAKEVAEERGADVIFTGEVLGQRPMSQYRRALDMIEEESGLRGRLLRPLSAQHLPATRAEAEGKIDRERLTGIEGRSRKEQLGMADQFGIDEFPAPSGGCCFLADRNFARRMRDMLAHRDPDTVRSEDLVFLKVGRHFRLASDLKIILARDETEGNFLKARSEGHWTCQAADGHGAFGRVEGEPGPERMEPIASLAARYCKHRKEPRVEILLRKDEKELRLSVAPARDEWAQSLRV